MAEFENSTKNPTVRVKLTKTKIDALKPKEAPYTVWDETIAGFGVFVAPTGRKTFILKYRTADGTQRKPTLATYGPCTLEQARDLAKNVLARVRAGEDPSGKRKADRIAPTVANLVERYLQEHAVVHKKPSSVRADRVNLSKHVLPAFGRRKVASVTFDDINKLHKSMSKTPGAANRTLALLSKMFNLAEQWQLRPLKSNPCTHVKKFKERKLHRDLTELELARLARVLLDAESDSEELRLNPNAIAAIRLLLFTGMRRGEVLRLKWSEVDLEYGVLRLYDSKTGSKIVRLNSAAIEIIKNQKRLLGNDYVFPGTLPGRALFDVKRPWRTICERADLPDLRLHDVRHNYASAGLAGGLSLAVIGRLLGHRTPTTTARYADLADDPARAAAELVGQKISEAMKGDDEKKNSY